MAQFGKDLDNFSASRTIRIIGAEQVETYTVYIIEVSVSHYNWTVRHRYNDFLTLHEKLISVCKIDKGLLPPKKVFGNQSESFVKKRQTDLEAYLQTVLYYVAHKVPPVLAAFLHFDLYEIHGITQAMAEELYTRGDTLLQSRDIYKVTPLQLYSLTERLKLPEPTCDSGDVKKDIGHILDFITRVKYLKVVGNTKHVGSSNINMKKLKFDLTLFKSLQSLEVYHSIALNIAGIDTVKQTLDRICMHYCLNSIREVLLQDIPQWKAEDGTLLVSYWDGLIEADFSHNNITDIDDSVQLMPRVEVLCLHDNHISNIQHLNWLSQLTHLDLSKNALKVLDSLHAKLGNLKTLNLSGNKLEGLQGLSKLFSLENLDVSDNKISQMNEVQHVCKLPCLENLHLSHNPVTTVLDYRTKVLSMFLDRPAEVTLDDQPASQKELDTVAVLQAIQKSKDNKARRQSRKSVDETQSSETAVIVETEEDTPVASSSHASSGLNWSTVSADILSHSHSGSFTGTGSYSRSSSRDDSSSSRTNSCSQSLAFLQQAGPESPGEENLNQYMNCRKAIQKELSLTGSYDENLQNSDHKSLLSTSSSSSRSEERRKSRGHSSEDTSSISYIGIAKLPTQQNTVFTAWLQNRLFGSADDDLDRVLEIIVSVFWCDVIQFSRQEEVVSCCAVLTERRLFLLRLKSGSCGFTGVPDLETFYIMPLNNVQQIIAGPCYSYIRFEESFVGSSGTFVLIAADSDSGKSFMDSVQSAYGRSYDNGNINFINCSQNSDLGKHIFDQEDEEGLCTGRVVVASVVTILGVQQQALLLLSENKVYLVKDDCLSWPRPTFNDQYEDIKSKPTFTFLQQHSVMLKMSDIQIGPSVKIPRKHKRTSSFPLKVTEVRYEHFELSMIFQELIGPVGFHVCFLSQKSRDCFLDQLTNLRSEHTNRVSPSIREEPEGGNESSDSLDLSAGSEVTPKKRVSEIIDSASSGDENSGKLQVRPVRSKTLHPTTLFPGSGVSNISRKADLNYMTPELLKQILSGIHGYSLVKTLSPKLQMLVGMKGEEAVQYFHSDVALINSECEQLHFVLWSNVIPYSMPHQEITTCIMMSTRAIYFVSDQLIKSPLHERQAWMTHTRHKSDSVLGIQKKQMDQHHSSGIIYNSQKDSIIRCYHIFHYSDLRQVNVGLFDQSIRLTGSNSNSTYTVVTRDCSVTEKFLHQLTTMLSIFASPMVDKSPGDMEQDFYRAFNKRTKTLVEGMEYTHPSKVQFLYPGEDTMSDLSYIITEQVRLPVSLRRKADILMYILCYLATSECQYGGVESMEPRSLVLTSDYLCIINEDIASYPLPDFARGLPSSPRYHLTDIRKVEYLKRVLFFRENPQKMTLIFSDELEEIIVDTSVEHFSSDGSRRMMGRESPPEVGITILVQCQREVNKFMLLVKNQWREAHNGEELEIHNL